MRKPILAGLIGLAVLATSAAVDIQAASAQTSAIETIVVSVRQREESLVDVPATVTAITELTIRRAGIQRASDFIDLTPGVSLVDAAEVGDTQVNIRGINGARDAENSFALVIDGIVYTNPAAFNREYASLQQIEILKGPQGAIYGRNAAAGAMIVTTRKPTEEYEGLFKISYAEDDTVFGQASVSGPIIKDKLLFRVSGDFRTTDGFYRDVFLDKKSVDDFEAFNINGRLLLTPSDDLTLDAKVRYGEIEAAAIGFNASFALPILGDFGFLNGFEDVNEHEFIFQRNIDPLNEQDALELSLKMDWDMEWATLTAWTLYSDVEQFFYSDGTSGAFGFFNDEPTCEASVANLNAQGVTLPQPQVLGEVPELIFFVPNGSFLGPYTPTTCDGTQFQTRNQEDFSIELRLASPGDQRLRWLAGVYFLTINRQVGVNLGIDTGQGAVESIFEPQGSINPTEQLVYDDFDSDVYAVFGQLAYDVSETVEASVALRYDREERHVRNLVPIDATTQYVDFDGAPSTGGAPLNPGLDPNLNPDLNPDGSIPDQDRAFEQVQPKVSLTWDTSENLTLFGSWGIGFKSGGFNNVGSATTINTIINPAVLALGGDPVIIEDIFDKEKSSSFEAGFKAQLWDSRVRIEGAFFYTDVDDMQFFEFFVGSFGLLRVVNNVDKVEIYGGELSVNANLTDWLTVYAAGSIIDSKIKKNLSRPDTVGNKSPYTPDFTVNAGAEAVYPVADWGSLLVRADVNVVGPTWFHTVQAQERPTIFFLPGNYSRTQRDTYATLDLRAGIEADDWSLIFFGKNITNTKYLEEVIPAPEFGGSFIHPGSKRRFGVELTVRL